MRRSSTEPRGAWQHAPMGAPNYFVAFPVAADSWLERALHGAPGGLRRFHADDVHLTVAFLGNVGEERARAAWRVVLEKEVGVCSVRLGGLRGMGNPRRPSAISVVLTDGHEEVSRFIEALRGGVCEAAGVEPDKRAPLPHITIARPPRKVDPGLLRQAMAWAKAAPPVDVELTLDRLALYTGSDDRTVRQYRAVESTLLRAS